MEDHQHHLDQDNRAERGARMQVNLRPQVHEVCALRALTRLERVTTWSTRVEKRVLRAILE